MDDFDRALAGVPDVVEAQRLYEETPAKLPGVRGLTSTIVMKQVIEPRPLPAQP